jgi:hypothetical protein
MLPMLKSIHTSLIFMYKQRGGETWSARKGKGHDF